ncbi:hypothetical protein [Yoonia sp.]|uniref:hypothetical protein n=1 Tax=Yoonia sp. TaxID=2212373 RepID=UPI002E060018|nr:hypothetical protein [Yoonia sp.]
MAQRGLAFSAEEDLHIVKLRAEQFTYAQIARILLIKRSKRSIETRMHRLEKSGEADRIRARLDAIGARAQATA